MTRSCKVCDTKLQKMKLCTRCQAVLYCSRDCQVKDWPTHKTECNKQRNLTNDVPSETADSSSSKAIWETGNESDCVPSRPMTRITWSSDTDPMKAEQHMKYEPTNINFQKAFNDLSLKPNVTTNGHEQSSKKHYLFHNKQYFDVPVMTDSQLSFNIIVRASKNKIKNKVQHTWTGEEIFKHLSYILEIPLDKLKLINKGKIIKEDNIKDHIIEKAVFQAIGEHAEKETGINQDDIDLIMKQLHVDRNEAVKALKQNEDVVDAMLNIGNK